MKRIVLLCAGGMSTSILVNKMKEEARKRDLDCDIDAYAVESIARTSKDADVILLAPQVGYKYEDLKQTTDIPMGVIDMSVYGMLDGTTALNQALALIED